MRGCLKPWWIMAVGLPPTVCAADIVEVRAGPPTALSVSIYRASNRGVDALDLGGLGGFALVSETRAVSIPAGESRIRFEGVADGVQSESALLMGLPAGVLEKNHDAQVLSPAALVAAAVGEQVVLVRTDPKSGRATGQVGTIRSDADGGVLFESAGGLEALRCSGLPETFAFTAGTELTATPTLSVLVRNAQPLDATITLSYLARRFDWTANYVAQLSRDGHSMDIGGWVTLANGNSVTFPSAHAQVIAGRLNRESGDIEPVDPGGAIHAQCWPRGTTSDVAETPFIERASPLGAPYDLQSQRTAIADMAVAAPVPMAAQLVQEEQLGDLKLYRVPERTTLTSRQIKQVRLLDRAGVPVELLYGADVSANQDLPSSAASKTLRTRNDAAHHPGLALPSGRVASFVAGGHETLLLAEAPLRDVAVAEEFEFGIGESPDVQVRATRERTTVSSDTTNKLRLPLLPGVLRAHASVVDDVNRVEIRNARASAIRFELRVRLADGVQLIGADHAVGSRNGRPAFELSIPAEGSVIVRYQTASVRSSSR